jgi:hypothetical protein
MFWCALPIIGFPAPMIMGTLLVQGVYPFFIHTRLIGKLGILEHVLVTPSHHRVHHGNNEAYLDKNYGGILIIWDKLFGTFEEEHEEVVYGLTKQLESKSFMWQFFHFFAEIGYSFYLAKGFKNKLKVIYGRPDQIDSTVRAKMESFFYVKSGEGQTLNKAFSNYIIVQIALIIGVLIGVLYNYDFMDATSVILWSALIILTLINCGAVLEHHSWAFYFEYCRFINIILLIIYITKYVVFVEMAVAIVVFSLYWLSDVKKFYVSKLSAVD